MGLGTSLGLRCGGRLEACLHPPAPARIDRLGCTGRISAQPAGPLEFARSGLIPRQLQSKIGLSICGICVRVCLGAEATRSSVVQEPQGESMEAAVEKSAMRKIYL